MGVGLQQHLCPWSQSALGLVHFTVLSPGYLLPSLLVSTTPHSLVNSVTHGFPSLPGRLNWPLCGRGVICPPRSLPGWLNWSCDGCCRGWLIYGRGSEHNLPLKPARWLANLVSCYLIFFDMFLADYSCFVLYSLACTSWVLLTVLRQHPDCHNAASGQSGKCFAWFV